MARTKGSPNKIGAAVKDSFWLAFTKIGGPDRLAAWAKSSPRFELEFYRMLSRIMPIESHQTMDVRKQSVGELTTDELAAIAARGLAPARGLEDESDLTH